MVRCSLVFCRAWVYQAKKPPSQCGPAGRAEPRALAVCSPCRRSTGHLKFSLVSAVETEEIEMETEEIEMERRRCMMLCP